MAKVPPEHWDSGSQSGVILLESLEIRASEDSGAAASLRSRFKRCLRLTGHFIRFTLLVPL